MTEAKGENLTNVREQKERERRRKKYKFALVKWDKEIGGWQATQTQYAIEHKEYVLMQWWQKSHEVICDDQPYKVLKGMLKLLKENK